MSILQYNGTLKSGIHREVAAVSVDRGRMNMNEQSSPESFTSERDFAGYASPVIFIQSFPWGALFNFMEAITNLLGK